MAILKIDQDRLHALVMAEPLVIAGKHYGDPGSARLKGILRFIKHCARHATVQEKSNISVFTLMTNDADVDSLRSQHATAFQFGVTALGSIESLSVEVREDDSAFVWHSIPSELTKAIETGIVYRLVQSVETFSVKGTTLPVPKVVEDTVSQFWLNYFVHLREALIAYKDSMARTSKFTLFARPGRTRTGYGSSPNQNIVCAKHLPTISTRSFATTKSIYGKNKTLTIVILWTSKLSGKWRTEPR